MEDRSLETAHALSVQLQELATEAAQKNDPRLALQWVVLTNLFFPEDKSPGKRLKDYARAACLGSLRIFDNGSFIDIATPWDFFLMYCAEINITEESPDFGIAGIAFHNTFLRTGFIFRLTDFFSHHVSSPKS